MVCKVLSIVSITGFGMLLLRSGLVFESMRGYKNECLVFFERNKILRAAQIYHKMAI